eukprot:CAMPEP_0197606076 /NCGR_PEP_ID=MMETSP1326-20131121/44324_1 /TAXON_ID=1155430 /ORGANISM="Genus nov. species nov., Strain RCC2288" /LENGTH=62 /DNA_ID=CAMNT_0043173935 /DNA_START=216 /DNA_END=404 /DNA_ORIENTATION=-
MPSHAKYLFDPLISTGNGTQNLVLLVPSHLAGDPRVAPSAPVLKQVAGVWWYRGYLPAGVQH